MENISQMSLLEIAVKILEEKNEKVNIYSLIKEVLEAKNIDDADSTIAAQLYTDINASGKFVYVGNGEWDLKIRQSLDEYDKDGSAFNSKEDYVEEFEDEGYEDELSEDDLDEDEDEDNSDDDSDDDYSRDSLDDEDEEEETDEYDEEHESYEDEDFDEDKYNDLMDDYEDIYEN